jgi:DNA repair protein RecO (recombination protein O)
MLTPFSHVDLLMHRGRSMEVITAVRPVHPYGEPIVPDAAKSAAGAAMLVAAERLTPALRAPVKTQFLLLAGGLKALGEGKHRPRLILDAFLIRSLAVAGWGIPLEDCTVCSSDGYDVPRLTCYCLSPCPGVGPPRMATIKLMRALMRGDWRTADATLGKAPAECSSVVVSFLEYYLEASAAWLRDAYKALGK